MKPERNAAAEPQTEARRVCGQCGIAARDERTVCKAERGRSRGREGRAAIRGAEQHRALVTAVTGDGEAVRLMELTAPVAQIAYQSVWSRASRLNCWSADLLGHGARGNPFGVVGLDDLEILEVVPAFGAPGGRK